MCSGGDKTNEGHGESSGPFRFGAVERDLSGTFQPFHNRVHRREEVAIVFGITIPFEQLIPDVHGSDRAASMPNHVAELRP